MGNDNKKNSTFPFFAHTIFFFQCFCSLVPIRIYFFFIVSCTESRFMLNTNYQRSAHIKSFLQMQIEAIYLKAYSHVFVQLCTRFTEFGKLISDYGNLMTFTHTHLNEYTQRLIRITTEREGKRKTLTHKNHQNVNI